jgi:hypothetical protein
MISLKSDNKDAAQRAADAYNASAEKKVDILVSSDFKEIIHFNGPIVISTSTFSNTMCFFANKVSNEIWAPTSGTPVAKCTMRQT